MKTLLQAFFLAALPALLVAACAGKAPARPEPESMPKSVPAPPVAAVRPHVVESPNGNRTDEYYWMRDDQRRARQLDRQAERDNDAELRRYNERLAALTRQDRSS